MLARRPQRQAAKHREIGCAIADLVDDEAPQPLHVLGAGHCTVEVGPARRSASGPAASGHDPDAIAAPAQAPAAKPTTVNTSDEMLRATA